MSWHVDAVPFKFQLSDITLFSVLVPLQVRALKLPEILAQGPASLTIPGPPRAGTEGFYIHAMPLKCELPAVSRIDDYICYAKLQYQHSYIDLSGSWGDYEKKFSSKTRSTIKRKVNKFTQHCGGALHWRTFRTPDEMSEFYALARAVSRRTYQERLLDAGIPASDEFLEQMKSLATKDRIRAYILFDRERPVSYLYCPIDDGVLSYAYLGYDPGYLRLSVGIVLQWLALGQLFDEAKFRYFDFTEGQSDHKQLFATHQVSCGNLIFLRSKLRNLVLVYTHSCFGRLSKTLGSILERWGVKAKVKQLIRFRAASAASIPMK
jgi:CelD/BcsL family acetyltransferase involved in cellulose biosynthesis